MKELIVEILLRLVKPIVATVLGLVVYSLAVTFGGGAQGVPPFLVCWLVGAALVLLVESGPI